MKARLKSIVDPDVVNTASQRFHVAIQVLILISIVTFTMTTIPDLSLATRTALIWVEHLTVFLFTLEYLVRIWVAERKSKFIFSYYGLIDFLAILPFYIGLGFFAYVGPNADLRWLRILRLFRTIRALKLLRYNRAIKHFVDALREIKEELVIYLVATAVLMYIAATGIYYFEHDTNSNPEAFKSVVHSLWWAVITLTTVGYGDVYPESIGGRIFTAVMLLLGLGIISVPSGLIAAGLIKTRFD
jgi:voltage-gated potassium channel